MRGGGWDWDILCRGDKGADKSKPKQVPGCKIWCGRFCFERVCRCTQHWCTCALEHSALEHLCTGAFVHWCICAAHIQRIWCVSGLDWKRSHLPMAWTIVQMYKHGPEMQNVKICHLSIHGQTHVMYGKAMHNHICKASHAHIHSYLLFGVFCTSVIVVINTGLHQSELQFQTYLNNGKGVLCYILFCSQRESWLASIWPISWL